MPPKFQILTKAGKPLKPLSEAQRRLNDMRLEMARIDEEQAMLDLEEQLMVKRAKLEASRQRVSSMKKPPAPREEKQREEKVDVEDRVIRPARLVLTDVSKESKLKSLRRLHYTVNDYPLSRDTVMTLAQRVLSVAEANKNLKDRMVQLAFRSAGGVGKAVADIVVMDARNNMTLGAVITLLTELLENKIASNSGGEWLSTDLTILGKI